MTPKILLLDDDNSVRASLVKVLEKENYEVSQVTNGGDAINIFRSHVVDLAVLNVNMEEENGWSVF